MTAGTLAPATVLVGDCVSIPAVIDQSVPDVVHLLAADHQRHPFWVRAEDVDTHSSRFRGQVVAVWPEHLEVAVRSTTDEHFLTVPVDVATVLPYEEVLTAGHMYRPAAAPEPTWLYDGEVFYPLETFPSGAQDRDELPPRLTDCGHLRDL